MLCPDPHQLINKLFFIKDLWIKEPQSKSITSKALVLPLA
jgi:hypothetical protein